MSMLTTKGSKAPSTASMEKDTVLLATANMQLNQLRANSEYDEDDDLITSRPKTGSPPPTTNVTSPNSTGMNSIIFINSIIGLIPIFNRLKWNVYPTR